MNTELFAIISDVAIARQISFNMALRIAEDFLTNPKNFDKQGKLTKKANANAPLAGVAGYPMLSKQDFHIPADTFIHLYKRKADDESMTTIIAQLNDVCVIDDMVNQVCHYEYEYCQGNIDDMVKYGCTSHLVNEARRQSNGESISVMEKQNTLLIPTV